ncbi:Mineralocorticoid receptor [Sarcoptes scabiei]|uniref:Mineralocorticoid receptor n=1 Tax=Sarcoptes scabiei TaxID=52283 RepID=A0A834R017_SARSC|nr:Mineralocorticoid receptor [Sarcoptes scabiei]
MFPLVQKHNSDPVSKSSVILRNHTHFYSRPHPEQFRSSSFSTKMIQNRFDSRFDQSIRIESDRHHQHHLVSHPIIVQHPNSLLENIHSSTNNISATSSPFLSSSSSSSSLATNSRLPIDYKCRNELFQSIQIQPPSSTTITSVPTSTQTFCNSFGDDDVLDSNNSTTPSLIERDRLKNFQSIASGSSSSSSSSSSSTMKLIKSSSILSSPPQQRQRSISYNETIDQNPILSSQEDSFSDRQRLSAKISMNQLANCGTDSTNIGIDERVEFKSLKNRNIGGEKVSNDSLLANKIPNKSTMMLADQKCRICGDVPIGKNFGVITCGSCKIFFSRNIDSKERLQCRNNNRCREMMTKSNRRNCSACRLEKCIRLGMRVKRNRQKFASINLRSNQNRSFSESCSQSLNCNIFKSFGGSDVELTDQDDDLEKIYDDLPTLVPFNQVPYTVRKHSNIVTSDDRDDPQINTSFSSTSSFDSNDPNEIVSIRSKERFTQHSNQSSTSTEPSMFKSNSVSVIQQAPPSRPSSTVPFLAKQSLNIAQQLDTEETETKERDEIKNSDEISSIKNSIEDQNDLKLSIENGNGNEIEIATSKSTLPNLSSDTSMVSLEMNHSITPIDPFQCIRQSLMMDIDDCENEFQHRDVFNHTSVPVSELNSHTNFYDYNHFYNENYYKYYYDGFSNTQRCDDDSTMNSNENGCGDIDRSEINRWYPGTVYGSSVELCKIEAKSFADQDHALIGELEKWKPYIRIKLGLDYFAERDHLSDYYYRKFFDQTNHIDTDQSNSLMMIDSNHHNHHTLFAKELEKIENINMSCRMISPKPSSNDQLRAIFDSLERGIFHANKSFELYEELWSESEISDLIEQNRTGFNKKKNNLLHMLYHLRGVQNFDDNLNAWAIFNGMTYLVLFGAFKCPHSSFKCEKLIYFQYLYLFKRYFECMYDNEEKALQMLLWMLKLIRQLSPLCSDCLTACTHSLNPAVLQKIGPNYAECLMMEQKQLHKNSTKSLTNTTEFDTDGGGCDGSGGDDHDDGDQQEKQ